MPAIFNRQNYHGFVDIHKAKLNLAKWIRKHENMNPDGVTCALVGAYDFLYDTLYYTSAGFDEFYFEHYLGGGPETVYMGI